MQKHSLRKLNRVISGCVKAAAKAHGSITSELAGSVSKRITGQLLALYTFKEKHHETKANGACGASVQS
jgi:hypothetical protein